MVDTKALANICPKGTFSRKAHSCDGPQQQGQNKAHVLL